MNFYDARIQQCFLNFNIEDSCCRIEIQNAHDDRGYHFKRTEKNSLSIQYDYTAQNRRDTITKIFS